MLVHHAVILVLALLGMGLSAPLIRLARAPSCVYGVAGLVVLGPVLFTLGTLAGYTNNTWLALAGVALLPTLLGHGGLNFLLRHVGPARLSLWTLAEPVIATLVAWPMFEEIPSAQVIVGGAATLLGVALGVSRSTDGHTTQ